MLPELVTPRMILRQIVPADAAGPYLQWMNDIEVVRWLEARGRVYTRDDLISFIRIHTEDRRFHFFAMTLRDGHSHIGNIKLGPVDSVNRRADLGIIVGERAAWGRGYAREAISAVTDYAFGKLGLHKVTAGCYGANEGSRRAFLAAGFTHEGTRKGQFWDGPAWQDELLFGRLAAQ